MSTTPEGESEERFTDLFLASVREYNSMIDAYLKTEDMEHQADPEETNEYMVKRGGSHGPVSKEQLKEASEKMQSQLEELKWTYGVKEHDDDLDEDHHDSYKEALWLLNETISKIYDAEDEYDKNVTDEMEDVRDTIEEYIT